MKCEHLSIGKETNDSRPIPTLMLLCNAGWNWKNEDGSSEKDDVVITSLEVCSICPGHSEKQGT